MATLYRVSTLLAAGGMTVAMLSVVAGLEVQFALARPSLDLTTLNCGVDPASVDQSLKGDRLPITLGPRGENPVDQLKLPSGCESRFSSTRNAYANEVAGRCVAAARQDEDQVMSFRQKGPPELDEFLVCVREGRRVRNSQGGEGLGFRANLRREVDEVRR